MCGCVVWMWNEEVLGRYSVLEAWVLAATYVPINKTNWSGSSLFGPTSSLEALLRDAAWDGHTAPDDGRGEYVMRVAFSSG